MVSRDNIIASCNYIVRHLILVQRGISCVRSSEFFLERNTFERVSFRHVTDAAKLAADFTANILPARSNTVDSELSEESIRQDECRIMGSVKERCTSFKRQVKVDESDLSYLFWHPLTILFSLDSCINKFWDEGLVIKSLQSLSPRLSRVFTNSTMG